MTLPESFDADTLCNPLEGGGDRFVRARRVFHAVLVAKLESDGALTENKLAQRLYWFEVALSEKEVEQLIASAARHGMIVPLPDAGPLLEDDENGEIRWIPTERGRALPHPRGSALGDLGALLPGALDQLRAGLSGWSALAVAVLAATGIGAAVGPGGKVAGALTLFLFLLAWCLAAVRAEGDLAAAAAVWPRFRRCHPKRWEWQVAPLRAELLMGGILLATACFLVGWVADSRVPAYGGVLIGFVVLLIWAIYALPKKRAWQAEGH